MPEAEPHFITARLRGGILPKARRGELIMPLPAGLAYDAAGHVTLDPGTAIQGALTHLFAMFEATGSVTACLKAFHAAGLSFPRRHRAGPRKGEVDWQPLRHSTVLRVLPRQEWTSFIPGAHPGYSTLDQYNANLAKLTANAAAHGRDRAAGPPREGAALLQASSSAGAAAGG
jgi:hypothetical protein